jgi:arylsulfatase A-like enzyme/Flp pilus assembly protein TadD
MKDEWGNRELRTENREHSSFPIHPSSFILHPFLLALLLIAGCIHREPTRPNVLLITLDTFRADRLGTATPNLMRLASDGIRFANAESAVPLTLPSHATILSGVLPLHHGLRNNGAGSFPADRDTLATLFSRAGYRTGAFVSAFVLDHRFGLNRGFDVYDDAVVRDPGSASSYDAERRGGDTVDSALAWLKQRDVRPFFAWVHLYDAHAPYAPPAPYPQTYDGEIAYVDAQVGRLLSAIDRQQTIVVFVGDHGESLGEHGELTHGLLLYEPTLHVPFVMSAPGLLRARIVREPVSSVDLAPTVASLAGITFSGGIDGRDLAKALKAGDEPKPAELYAETEYPAIFGWSDLAALRRGNLKYIASTTPELYDLGADPREDRNVLADQRRAYHDLSTRLTGMRAGAASPKAQPSPIDEESKAKLASLGYVAPTSLVSTAGPRPAPQVMAPLFRSFEEATWATNDGRVDEAISILKTIVAKDTHNPVFRSTLAKALRQRGQLDAAIQLYQESVAIAPDDPEAWYNLAVALEEGGHVREAGIAIREAIRRDPSRPEAHNALGIAYSNEGNLQAAREEFNRSLAIDPRDARSYNNIGNVDRAEGRLDDAATAYRQALALSPNYVDALNGIGVIEVQRDDPKAALAHFDRALQIAPLFFEAQLNRGIALQLLGDRTGAAAQLRALIAALPQGAEFAAQRRAAEALLAGLKR